MYRGMWGFYYYGSFFFPFLSKNGVALKTIINLDKLCQLGTTSYVKVVPSCHDFVASVWSCAKLAWLLPCQPLKSCQLGTTLSMSYIYIYIYIFLFIYWVVSYVMFKINLIYTFLRVLVLSNKKMNNCVWIMFDGNVIY